MKVDVDIRQLRYRAVEVGEIGHEGDDRPDAQMDGRRVALDNPFSPIPIHQGWTGGGDHAEEQEHPAAHHGLAQLKVEHRAVALLEPLGLVVRPAEKAHQEKAAQVDHILCGGLEFGLFFLGFAGQAVADLADAAQGKHERGDNGAGQNGQAPIHGKENAHGGQDGDRIREDADEGAGDHVVDGARVVVDAREDFARPGRRVEPERHALKIPVEGVSQVEHQALTDLDAPVVLENPEEARRHGQKHEPENELVQERQVTAGQGFVEQGPDEKGSDQAQEFFEPDTGQDHRGHLAVRLEISRDALEQGALQHDLGPFVAETVEHAAQTVTLAHTSQASIEVHDRAFP